MKTIKELEAEFKTNHQRCVEETRVKGQATYLSHGARCESLANLNALKDVIKLIEELKWEDGDISAEELKARIER